MKTVGATEFKAKYSAFLDEIEKRGQSITITKRGRPVAVVNGAPKKKFKSLRGLWAGKGRIVGDIVNTGWADDWTFDAENLK